MIKILLNGRGKGGQNISEYSLYIDQEKTGENTTDRAFYFDLIIVLSFFIFDLNLTYFQFDLSNSGCPKVTCQTIHKIGVTLKLKCTIKTLIVLYNNRFLVEYFVVSQQFQVIKRNEICLRHYSITN